MSIVITLEDKDVLDLQEILLDEDARLALKFIETRIAPQFPEKGSSPCDSTRTNPFLVK